MNTNTVNTFSSSEERFDKEENLQLMKMAISRLQNPQFLTLDEFLKDNNISIDDFHNLPDIVLD